MLRRRGGADGSAGMMHDGTSFRTPETIQKKSFFLLSCLESVWLGSPALQRWSGDGEVAGLNLTYCTAEYNKPLTHTCLCHQAV